MIPLIYDFNTITYAFNCHLPSHWHASSSDLTEKERKQTKITKQRREPMKQILEELTTGW